MENTMYFCGELTPAEKEAARLARNQYMREYRRKHPEKNKQAIARYWARRAEKERENRTLGE